MNPTRAGLFPPERISFLRWQRNNDQTNNAVMSFYDFGLEFLKAYPDVYETNV
jgi:hypothetical protein